MVEKVVFDTDSETGWKVLEHKHKRECRTPEKTLPCAKWGFVCLFLQRGGTEQTARVTE